MLLGLREGSIGGYMRVQSSQDFQCVRTVANVVLAIATPGEESWIVPVVS